MDPIVIGAIGFVVFLTLIFIGLPISISAIVVGVGGMVLFKGTTAAISTVVVYSFQTVNSFNFSVVPLFILMGLTLFHCGVGGEIFTAARNWLGHLPGGLAASTTAACAAMGTCTGSSAATAAVMSEIAYPEMRKAGYDSKLSLGVVAASGTIAAMIPPSVPIVIYAILAEQSIGKLLIAGIIPGIVSASIYIAMIVIRTRFKPSLAPRLPAVSWRARLTSLKLLIPVLVMAVVIIGGIYTGIFMPTEAGAIGCVTAFAVVLVLRRLTLSRLRTIVLETIRITVLVMITLTGIIFLARFLAGTGLTPGFADMALGLPSPLITLALMIVVLFILGMFIDAAGMICTTVPVFVPAIIALGYDPIWFGILMIKMVEVAMVSPPVGINVYITQGVIKEISIEGAFAGVLPFLVCDIITLGLFIFVPQIITFLPATMVG